MTALERSILARAKSVGGTTLRDWIRHDATSKSAALAFYTLFSLAPLLILAVSLAGHFVGAHVAESAVSAQLRLVLGPTFADAVQQLLRAAITSGDSRKASVIATVMLVLGSTSTFAELKNSLDAIWEVERNRGSGLWLLVKTRLLSFGLLLALAFLALVSLMVNVGLDAFEHVWARQWPLVMGVLKPVSWTVSFAVITCLFALIYKVLPQKKLRWRDVLIGSLSSALLFTLGRAVISMYLTHGRLTTVYGAAGSAVVLTAWVYYSALVFFLGAEFTHQYVQTFGGDSPRSARARALLTSIPVSASPGVPAAARRDPS
jgi:membrane protein